MEDKPLFTVQLEADELLFVVRILSETSYGGGQIDQLEELVTLVRGLLLKMSDAAQALVDVQQATI